MLLDKSIKELHSLLVKGEISPVDLVKESYQNIAQWQPVTNAFITIRDEKEVMEEAAKIKVTPDSSLLAGIPYSLKDAYVTEGIKTTSASHVLDNFIPPYSATVYKKLQDAGAILLGKTNMDAWGHGGTSENTDYRAVHNPWDTSRVAGGSSGGAAVAVAARIGAFAVGEDTGGSIRNPASWNNITGLKVTYGRVSRYGAIAYASSFDTVGPMAKTAQDCACVLQVIAGADPYDATSLSAPVPDYENSLSSSVKNKVIGIPTEMYGEGLDTEIKVAIMQAADKLKDLGCTLKEISMPIMEYGLPTYYLMAPSQTSSNLARYDGIRYGEGRDKFTPETMRRIMIGTYALSAGYYDAYYRKALKVRTLLKQAYDKAFDEVDYLLMPVTPTMPPKLGELTSDPLAGLLADIYTTTQNPVGIPALALPAGFSKSGLPIGMQLVGNLLSEAELLNLGHLYQQATNIHKRSPGL